MTIYNDETIRYTALICTLAACNSGDKRMTVDNSVKPDPYSVINYRIVAQYPHDTGAYSRVTVVQWENV